MRNFSFLLIWITSNHRCSSSSRIRMAVLPNTVHQPSVSSKAQTTQTSSSKISSSPFDKVGLSIKQLYDGFISFFPSLSNANKIRAKKLKFGLHALTYSEYQVLEKATYAIPFRDCNDCFMTYFLMQRWPIQGGTYDPFLCTFPGILLLFLFLWPNFFWIFHVRGIRS